MAGEDQIPDFMREEAPVDLSSMASDEKIGTVQRAAQRLVDLEAAIKKMESETLPEMKRQRTELAQKTLPSLFESVGTDRIGVPSADVDVVVEPYYFANIKADWPEEQRQAAFDHLERDLELGNIVSVTLTMVFTRGDIEKARECQQMLLQSKFGNSNPPRFDMGVPWNTLTAALKEVAQRRPAPKIDLEKLGATIGETAKIKKRKK